MSVKPFKVASDANVNNSAGIRPWLTIPNDERYSSVDFAMATGAGFSNATPPKNLRINTPKAKTRFQESLFHSNPLKVGPGTHAAQICLRVEEIPSRLLPIRSKRGTV